jgi:hypothetical protein
MYDDTDPTKDSQKFFSPPDLRELEDRSPHLFETIKKRLKMPYCEFRETPETDNSFEAAQLDAN